MVAVKDPRIDEYIAKSGPFAQPILRRLRKVVHAGCPDVEETLKWGHPSFLHEGLLCGMAAFKAHCTFGFWKHELLVSHGLSPSSGAAMGQFGHITSVDDLPEEKALVRLVKAAAALNESGARLPPKPRAPKNRTIEAPPDLAAALRRNAKARATFEAFTYSRKKDYVEWLTEAKTEATRRRRLETAVEWMAEGKPRNWKYMDC